MPVINRDTFERWGNAQDFNENLGAGSSVQLAAKPVSLLGWGCKESSGGARSLLPRDLEVRVIFGGHWCNYSV